MQSGVKYTTNLIGCAMTLTKNILTHINTHSKTHYTVSIHTLTLKQLFTNTFSSIKTMLILFYKLMCETNDYFNKRKLQTTFVSSKEDILSITQIYFRKSEKEKSESEFSLSSKSILQWFTLTTATTALHKNNPEHSKQNTFNQL